MEPAEKVRQGSRRGTGAREGLRARGAGSRVGARSCPAGEGAARAVQSRARGRHQRLARVRVRAHALFFDQRLENHVWFSKIYIYIYISSLNIGLLKTRHTI